MLWGTLLVGILIGAAVSLSLAVLFQPMKWGSINPKTDQLRPKAWPYIVWPLLACGLVFGWLATLLVSLDIHVFDERTWFALDDLGRRISPAEGARDVFLSVGGLTASVVAALTLGNAMRRSATMERQEVIAKRVEENDRRRLAGDTFSKAAELLGSSDEAQRLGGLHSLELLSRGVDEDTEEQISHTLSAFIRARSKKYLDKIYREENVSDSEVEESLKSAITIILRRFGNDESKVDLSSSYIPDMDIGHDIRNVHFQRSATGLLNFSGRVSLCSFRFLRGAEDITFLGDVEQVALNGASIKSLWIGAVFPNEEQEIQNLDLSTANIGHLSIGEGLSAKSIQFDWSKVRKLYAFEVDNLKPEQLKRMWLVDIEDSYFPQTWRAEQKAELFEAWRARDEAEDEIPF